MQQISGAHNDTYSLITFADWATVCFSSVPAGDAHRRLGCYLNGLVPRNGTNYCSGLTQALPVCKSEERRQPQTCQQIVIFLSDGEVPIGLHVGR